MISIIINQLPIIYFHCTNTYIQKYKSKKVNIYHRQPKKHYTTQTILLTSQIIKMSEEGDFLREFEDEESCD